jgi:hypothetical protein
MSAMAYGFLFVVFSTVGVIATLLGPRENASLLVFAFLPLFYVPVAYISTAIGCGIYNLVAGWVGGIEVILEEEK